MPQITFHSTQLRVESCCYLLVLCDIMVLGTNILIRKSLVYGRRDTIVEEEDERRLETGGVKGDAIGEEDKLQVDKMHGADIPPTGGESKRNAVEPGQTTEISPIIEVHCKLVWEISRLCTIYCQPFRKAL